MNALPRPAACLLTQQSPKCIRAASGAVWPTAPTPFERPLPSPCTRRRVGAPPPRGLRLIPSRDAKPGPSPATSLYKFNTPFYKPTRKRGGGGSDKGMQREGGRGGPIARES